MTGEEDEFEIVQTGEHGTNVVKGKVSGTVVQFDQVGDVEFGDGIVIRARPAKED
ncbi:hypothetical protein LFM09_20730 [Lentzea alba]|uniref:hypothetical protein n=1 Tax=Lentzea alba TaxID=2714351 RepID=UPI0039BFF28C